jgi:hypothetical protein
MKYSRVIGSRPGAARGFADASFPRGLYTTGAAWHFSVPMNASTLAERLGTTTHLSPLLHKARRLGLGPQELETLAIQRGCDYYDNGEAAPFPPVTREQFSNAELGIALLNPALRYDPQSLRLGAAMLGAADNRVEDIARLARFERAEAIVRYVAECGEKFEPENAFWADLLQMLPVTAKPKSSVMPHPTRFVAMTGITRRGVGTVAQWIRPIARG